MHVCKYFRFIHLVVALGLVACSRGNNMTSSHVNTSDDNFINSTQPADLTKLSPFTNSPNTEKSSSSSPALPRRAQGSTVAPPDRSPVRPTAETHREKNSAALLLIILGVLVVVCVILLVIVVLLACKVCYLQGQLRSWRPPLTNGAGNWSRGQGGQEVVGADETETGTMLEAVTAEKDEEEMAQPGRAQEVTNEEGNSKGKEAGLAKEPESGMAAADATASEPTPAADPEADKSSAPQNTPAPTSEPTPDEP